MAHKHTIFAVLLLSSASALASPAEGGRKPPPDDKAPRELIELRTQLARAGRAQAKADIGRFRALCDQDGFPLVGNIANKSNMYQPSELCSDVRNGTKK